MINRTNSTLDTSVEQKLKHTALRLNQAQAIAHLGSWEMNFSTGVAVWSDEALRIYGLSLEDSKQSYESWISFIHPEDLDHVLQTTKDAISTPCGFSCFHRIIRKDGTIKHLYTKAELEFNNDGEPLGLYGIIHDVTEMKKVEEELKNSERILAEIVEFNQKLIDVAAMGIASYDAVSGKCLSSNASFEKIVGATREDVLKQNFMHIESWKHSGMLKDAENTLLSEKVHHNEVHITTSFGNEVWINYRFTKFLHHGKPHLLLLLSDISERVKAAAALKQSEFRYRQIVEAAQEGIWMIDGNNKTIFVNRKMCEILEYTQEEMLGKENFYFMDDSGRQEASESIERRKKGIKETVEIRYITKSGKHIWTNISANPIFDEHGNYKGALAMVSDITEKKKLTELLNKTNNLARIGNWKVNLVAKTLFWSTITKEIHEVDLDFTPSLETAINFYKAGLSRDSITHAIQKAIENGNPWDLELEIVTAKGKEYWVRAMGEAQFMNGKCIKLYGSFQDIDARKRSELETLKIYEEKNTILESIADGFYAVDKNWTVTYWNKEAEILLGKKRGEIIGKNIWEVYPESVDTITYANYHKAVKENTSQHYERFNKSLNRWAEISVYPSTNGLSVYFRDVTNRKITEQLLLQSQSSLKAVIENTDASIYSLDRDFRYVAFNERLQIALKEAYGLSIKLGDNVYEFLEKLNPEEAKGWQEVYSKALKGETVKFEREFTFNNLSTYSSFSIHPIWENKNIIGLSCFVFDITQQKQNELQKEKMTTDLIQRNKDLEQFSYIVSHNLRAPVANIIGLTEALNDDTNSVDVKKMFNKELTSSATRLDNVITDLNNILTIKREVNEKKESVNLSKLVNDIQSSIKNIIQKENVHIKTDFSDLNEFITLKSYLYSIFFNLISNSIKYRQPGLDPLIEIKSERKNEKIIITFKDNGIGIDLSKKRDQVFGLYKRFHQHVEGKGMGLFMVKTQVETLGGKITIESEPNQGTELKIELNLYN